ncbi:MAG: hypothetical protein AB7H86_01755 [Blastocatellales bacterium]
MSASRNLMTSIKAIFICLLITMSVKAADPGAPFPAGSEVSDQKAGSVLYYNYYSSSATASNTDNTRINITNTNDSQSVYVHLFFVADSCSVADAYICLTANQTATFLTSDFDPGFKGYIIAIATDRLGIPRKFNYLIGDEFIKLASGHFGNLGAEAFAAVANETVPILNDGTTAFVPFDGFFYNMVPRVLAVSNIPSRTDGNDTLVIINRVGGTIAISGDTIGSIFGLLYDDAENVLSFTLTGGCQKAFSVSNTEPRTVPRFETFIPSGRSGWMKFWAAADRGLLGATINLNRNAGSQASAYNGASNMHKLTLTKAGLGIPVFPAGC